ncbi:MAG: hypothetical protein KAH46_31585 [Mycobacterium sp.]|nr:hypothetical protein [Mycobacterium sp.]
MSSAISGHPRNQDRKDGDAQPVRRRREETMEKYGLETWHDYATLVFLIAVLITSALFPIWERHARHRGERSRLRRQPR